MHFHIFLSNGFRANKISMPINWQNAPSKNSDRHSCSAMPPFSNLAASNSFQKSIKNNRFFYRALHVQHIIISERKCEYKKKANDAYRSKHYFFPKTLHHIHQEDGNEEQKNIVMQYGFVFISTSTPSFTPASL